MSHLYNTYRKKKEERTKFFRKIAKLHELESIVRNSAEYYYKEYYIPNLDPTSRYDAQERWDEKKTGTI